MEEKKSKKIGLKAVILIIMLCIIVAVGIAAGAYYLGTKGEKTEASKSSSKLDEKEKDKVDDEDEDSDEKSIAQNELSDFDLEFMKLENEENNNVYSPLSIKYALKMLEEGAKGNTKKQISKLIGDYTSKEYVNSKNLSFANGIFIRDSFEKDVKEDYIDTLKEKYNADVKLDSFESADTINNWIKSKTLDIIEKIIDDVTVNGLDFALVNALAIDMEWEDKFIHRDEESGMAIYNTTEFLHERRKENKNTNEEEYEKMWIDVSDITDVTEATFKGADKNMQVAGMHIEATINNYDIIKELGEEEIKNTVTEEYTKFAKGQDYDSDHAMGDFALSEDKSDAGIKKALDEFLPKYISEIKTNYHKIGKTTDFEFYTDDDVKVFAKDLKEYDGTTLQYIAIMPTEEDLTDFVDDIDAKKISKYISSLKSLDTKNFKEGIVTKITGYIPKFDFEYSLNLKEDLTELGVTDVFDKNKADLGNMVESNSAYISTALHKANIQFTEDGIKAAAVTLLGGLGAGFPFDYYFDVPVEDIDLTFDKPYMFLIRDKETGETWFAGTVYEPLLWEEK